MLYAAYEMQRQLAQPVRLWANALQQAYSNPYNPLTETWFGKSVAAGAEIVARLTQNYAKPEFGLETTQVGNDTVAVNEEILLRKPFCQLVRFRRDTLQRDPKVLVVAPMSGHYATLLRGTVEALLPEHDVHITDWTDAREVPLSKGNFDLDDYIDYIIEFCRYLGPDVHIIAVCQPSVPVMAAAALMAEAKDPRQPKSLTLMGGPIDTRQSPTVPNDLAMRNSLVAETMPGDRLMAAMGVARTTSDSARVVGALAGAGLFALLGMGQAYLVVTLFYGSGFLLTLGVGTPRHAGDRLARVSFWRDLREGMAFIADSPQSLAAMWLAFLVNLTAFPLTGQLLPYVARNIYHIDQTGLGTLVASFASGALVGSVIVSLAGRALRPARMMLVAALVWYSLLLVFVEMPNAASGRMMLAAAGFAQSLSMVPMAVMLLHSAGAKFRGRVMGVRMLAVYGLPLGLLAAGFLIERIGYTATALGYCVFGLLATAAIALRWRQALWPLDAPGNAR